MYMISKRRGPAPRVLRSPGANSYRAELAIYLDREDASERPPKPPYALLENAEVRQSLNRLFHGKCAYCETPVQDFGEIDLFRPANGAEGTGGDIFYQHYCWLALDWANIYLACSDCLREKRNRFPAEQRGPVRASVAQLRRLERATLLDPCSDEPFEHLEIEPGGYLTGKTERGRLTIDILDLNRTSLVHDRATTMTLFMSAQTPLEMKVDALRPEAPFAGVAWLALMERLPSNLARQLWRQRPTSRHVVRRLVLRAFADGGGNYNYRVPVPEAERRRYVKRVTVRNFRGLKKAVLDFPPRGKEAKTAGSVVVLGDNGVGKTSLLQAVALGCLGPRNAEQAGISPRWCLTEGEQRGEIAVEFWGTERTNLVRFDSSSELFEGQESVPVMVLGYGAYRLAARGELGVSGRGYDYRVRSLFSERALVNGALGLRQHLTLPNGVPDRDRLQDASRALNAVLRGRAKASLGEDNRLIVDEYGRSQPLDELSSGFKSVVAITADIMDVMYEVWNGMTSAQAFILIDEIDAHLHPSWRLAVVEALRDTFPLAQFLMTTHDPLPLRGLAEGEIVILDRNEDGIRLERPTVRAVNGMTVDQILTSDLFGLETTLDAETADRLSRYYSLLSRPIQSVGQQRELAAVEAALPPEIPLGDSPRERLMYRIIDTYLARHRSERVDKLSQESVNELVDLFEAAEQDMIRQDREGQV